MQVLYWGWTEEEPVRGLGEMKVSPQSIWQNQYSALDLQEVS